MENKRINKIWIIHGCMLFLFIGSMGLFFLLGGGSTPTSDEVSTNNRDIIDFPDIITDDVADNRLEAYNQATAILKQEEEERELQKEHNSFHFFSEKTEQKDEVAEKGLDEETNNSLRSIKQALCQTKTKEEEPKKISGNRSYTSTYKTTNKSTSEGNHFDEEDLELMKEREKAEKLAHLREVYYGSSNTNNKTLKEEPIVKQTNNEVVEQNIPANGFKPLNKQTTMSDKGCIQAVIHNEQRNVTSSSQVKLRILDPIHINGTTIPANTVIIGMASFNKNRVHINIDNIVYNNNVYPFRGTIYDRDGAQGIYFPENLVDDVKTESSGEAINNTDVSFGNLPGLISTGAHAITEATRNALNNTVREPKVTLTTNYKLIIKMNE